MKNKMVRPSSLELQILKQLWDAKRQHLTPLSVREVRDMLAEGGKELAHTTVITTLENMVKKRLLRRSRRKNANFYNPIVSEENVQQTELAELVKQVFSGSSSQLVSTLLNSSDINKDSLSEIKKMIDQAEKNQS